MEGERVRVRGWLVPTLVCAGLSIVYLIEWRSSRSEQRLGAEAFAQTVKGFEKRLAIESTQTRAVLKRVGEAMERLSPRPEPVAVAGESQALAQTEAEGDGEAPLVMEHGDDPCRHLAELTPEEDATLPRVPEGVYPVDVVESLDLREFFANPLFNPDGVELDIVERHRAANLVAHTKARLLTLESDFLLLTAEESPRLIEEGVYIDYAKGEKKDPMKGVFTIGHLLPNGGTRIIPFFREEFPVLYEIKEEMKRVSENAVRQLMALVAR